MLNSPHETASDGQDERAAKEAAKEAAEQAELEMYDLCDQPEDSLNYYDDDIEFEYLAAAFVPAHGHKYIEDDFIGGFAGSFGFFMFITSLVPVARLINRIATEKETKVREAMRMMGMIDTPYWLSWIIMYLIIYTAGAIGCTLIGWIIFKYSDKFLVFLMFFFYGTSCLGYSLLISSMFYKSKTATLIGVLVFFVTYFSMFSIDDNTP